MSLHERSALLPSRSLTPEYRNEPKTTAGGSTSSEEWNSTYSSSSLYCSDQSDDNFIPDWDAFVQDDGNLFYIEYDALPAATTTQAASKQHILQESSAQLNKFNRASTRRSKKSSSSKLSKMMNRRQPLKDKNPPNTQSNAGDAKVKFREIAEGEIKEIRVLIDPSMRHKYGRRASVSEAILGVSICPFADGKRIMVASYMPNSSLGQDKFVKVGDWLKAINDEEVSVDSIDLMLLGFGKPTEIKLTLQRMSGEEQVTQTATMLTKITSMHDMNAVFGTDSGADVIMPFVVMYLTMNDLEENGIEGQDVIFCYPPKNNNALYACRGSFLTINSLLKNVYHTTPVATTVTCNSVDYNIVYKAFNDDLLLVGISSNHGTLTETKLKAAEIMRCIEFQHQTVGAALSDPQGIDYWEVVFTFADQLCRRSSRNDVVFETALPEPHHVPLPKEAQLRIDDALGEMEAMDYREWNDEPLKSHREFYIIGSALFYRRYLLASHLPPADLIDIEAYLRMHGILNVLDTQSVRDLVIWQEVYPKSVERGLSEAYGIPKGRWFLAVIARSHMLLAVILESRHDNTTGNDIRPSIPPSPFYIEEIQDTFEHLKTGGIENLASTWIQSNKRPQILKENSTSTLPATKKTEIISILKRRNNSAENLAGISSGGGGEVSGNSSKLTSTTSMGGSSSVNSQTLSEDSNHDESDSDWDGFPDSQRSSSGFDIADMSETLLREVSDVLPSKITAGNENVLFHYVQIEVGQGILLAPTGLAPDDPIICAFRKASLLIHNILQNTIRFRNLLALESSTPSSHRSLVAIKEHGILISVDTPGGGTTDFWVIGRLFTSPPKELYVCHRADVPQNLLEMTFRLSLNSAG